MTKFALCITLATLTLFFSHENAALCQPARAPKDKPNIVVILADDLGYSDLGCFGSRLIKTPNIDKMAAEGVRFTDFYVAAPTCTPSRAALLTGKYPQRLGFGDQLRQVGDRISPSKVLHANSPYGLSQEAKIIPEVLSVAGYKTGMVGKWHLGDAPEFNPVNQGFDYYFGVPYSNDMKPFYYLSGTKRLEEEIDQTQLITRFTDEATSFIKSSKDEPFFLYLAHTAPHTPLHADPDFAGKSQRGLYGDLVEELDSSVGHVLEAIRASGLEEHTLVIFTSDNGPWLARGEQGGTATPLRNGKGSTYEGGLRVPCVMRWPGVVKAGRVSSDVASTLDLLPTFAALANGASLPAGVDGKDISTLLKDQESVAFPEPFFYYFGNELHAVRSGPWKYRAENNLTNENIYWRDAPTTISIPAALYNLVDDPGEQKDVQNQHPKITEQLMQYLEAARIDTGDSLTGKSPVNAIQMGERKTGL